MMEDILRIEIILAFTVLLFVIFFILRKGKMPVKYSLVWLFSAVIMILSACFPQIIGFITRILGFELISNVILSIFLGLLIFITISLTVIISGQAKKINLLVQEVSLLKQKKKKKDKEN